MSFFLYLSPTTLNSSSAIMLKPVKHSGKFKHRQPTNDSIKCPQCVFMYFVWIWEQTVIISLYNINWQVFITETECVYCAVRTGSLYTASLTFSNSTFCAHNVFMCFVWIWEQTEIISLNSINWLVFITETECIYCAVRIGSLCIIQVSVENENIHNTG